MNWYIKDGIFLTKCTKKSYAWKTLSIRVCVGIDNNTFAEEKVKKIVNNTNSMFLEIEILGNPAEKTILCGSWVGELCSVQFKIY